MLVTTLGKWVKFALPNLATIEGVTIRNGAAGSESATGERIRAISAHNVDAEIVIIKYDLI